MFMGVLGTHSVHPRLSVLRGGGGGGGGRELTGSQFLEGNCWKSGSDFFQGGVAVFT